MSAPLKFCDECVFHRYNAECDETGAFDAQLYCAKAHTPRFYEAATRDDAQRGNFGYMRLCDDFADILTHRQPALIPVLTLED